MFNAFHFAHIATFYRVVRRDTPVANVFTYAASEPRAPHWSTRTYGEITPGGHAYDVGASDTSGVRRTVTVYARNRTQAAAIVRRHALAVWDVNMVG